MAKKTTLTFQFENSDAMGHFWSWLCGSGEQSYWEWMKEREAEEDGDITVLDFDYTRADMGVVTTKIGRFTGDALVDGDFDLEQIAQED